MSLIEWPAHGKIQQIYGCDICQKVESQIKGEGEYHGVTICLLKGRERKVICSECLGLIRKEEEGLHE